MTDTFSSLHQAIASLCGSDAEIKEKRTVHGGDCNDAQLLLLTDGTRLFLKSNDIGNLSFFTSERLGLLTIEKTGAIATPRVLAAGTDRELGISFLLMDYIEEGKKQPDFFADFGRRLSALHKADASSFVPGGRFGFTEDNIIGFRPQINTPHNSFISFFRDCRLLPQITDAKKKGYLSADDLRMADHVLSHLDDYLIEPDAPSLVHGDLWGGNYMTGNDGLAVLIDPAAHVSHREVDLAMSEMFGGFSEDFYRAYEEAFPLQQGYRDRRPLYDLYQMLNHLNQFGASYLGSVRRILARYA